MHLITVSGLHNEVALTEALFRHTLAVIFSVCFASECLDEILHSFR